MAVSKGANTYNRQNWEESEFPLLCQTCLGDNPYVRMMKEKHGKECKTCNRPFTVFRWCPGTKMRFKKTEVCQTCSQMKNICQTCLLDLEYGLPVQVRDAALRVQDSLPKSDVNKEYHMQQIEREIEEGGGTNLVGAIGQSKSQAPSDMLLKLARTSPYYKRNRPHICSFWVKGECKRGEECPYRHERPTDPDDPLADQNIRDRFYGTNDPVADKLMKRYHDMPKLEPPEDKTVTTLYVGGLGEKVQQEDLKNYFYQFGEIRSVNVVQKQQCGFVQFTNRTSAEKAAEASFSRLILKGQRLIIKWGRSQGQQSTKKDQTDKEEILENQPGPSKELQMIDEDMGQNFFNLPPPPPQQFMHKGGPMPMGLPGPPGGNFAMQKPFGVGMNPMPYEPYSYHSDMKMQPPQQFHQPSKSSKSHSRESGGKIQPFGANLSQYASQNPHRMGAHPRR